MKAILIIDIPDDLIDDYENFYVDYDLRGERKDINVNESIKYVEDCPLKPIPKKRREPGEKLKNNNSSIYYGDCRFVDGWNACIDEILGG